MDHCDIVFIHACPAAAVIYYYTQLFQSHCLYCPHSIQVPVRELGRNLLHILDSVGQTRPSAESTYTKLNIDVRCSKIPRSSLSIFRLHWVPRK
jgi:hypothetical protein